MAEQCCESEKEKIGCCDLEAVVSIDDRGQIVLPKSLRQRAGIEPSDKLVLVSCADAHGVNCITIFKAKNMIGIIKDAMEPVVRSMQ